MSKTQEELEWFLNGHPTHLSWDWGYHPKRDGEILGRCGLLPWTIEGRQEWRWLT